MSEPQRFDERIELTADEESATARGFALWAMGEYLGFVPTDKQRPKIAAHALDSYREGYKHALRSVARTLAAASDDELFSLAKRIAGGTR